MDKATNLTYGRLKHTIGAWVGDHQAGQGVPVHGHLGPNILHVDGAVQSGLDRHHLHPSHLGRGRVRAMRRERNEADIPAEEVMCDSKTRFLPLSVTLRLKEGHDCH